VYSIVLEYPAGKDAQYCDNITHSAVTELFLHGIHASQSTHDTIILHDTKDLTVAIMLLSNSSLYTAKIGSK
jgi:hypothetical protein